MVQIGQKGFRETRHPRHPRRVPGVEWGRQLDTRKTAKSPHDQDHRVSRVSSCPHCYPFLLIRRIARGIEVWGTRHHSAPGTRRIHANGTRP